MTNKSILLTITGILIFFNFSFSQRQQLLYLPFTGNAIDATGNGYDGINSGATLTYDVDGNPESAYHFDGINDEIKLPLYSENDFDLVDSLTVSAWIRLLDNQVFQAKAISKQQYGGYGIGFNVDTTMRFYFSCKIGNNYHIINALEKPVLGEWYHVTATFYKKDEFSVPEMKLYINGALQVTLIVNLNLSMSESNVPLTIGSNPSDQWSSIEYWPGDIDEVRVYNYAQSEDEIQDLFTKVEDFNNETNYNIKIYPNPSKSFIYIENDINQILKIDILNINGACIKQDILDSNLKQIDISTFPQGVYFVNIKIGKEIITKKIIKN